jgi:putative lipoic acid-binding regulatory protein
MKDVFNFPCTFPLKVIGRNTADFEAFVIAVVRRHVPKLDVNLVTSRTSSGNAYLSVTVTFIASSREQLDALYSDLGQHEQVLMLL